MNNTLLYYDDICKNMFSNRVVHPCFHVTLRNLLLELDGKVRLGLIGLRDIFMINDNYPHLFIVSRMYGHDIHSLKGIYFSSIDQYLDNLMKVDHDIVVNMIVYYADRIENIYTMIMEDEYIHIEHTYENMKSKLAILCDSTYSIAEYNSRRRLYGVVISSIYMLSDQLTSIECGMHLMYF